MPAFEINQFDGANNSLPSINDGVSAYEIKTFNGATMECLSQKLVMDQSATQPWLELFSPTSMMDLSASLPKKQI